MGLVIFIEGDNMKKLLMVLGLVTAGSALGGDGVDPDQGKIESIVSSKCLACHSGAKPKGRLALDKYEVVLKRKKAIIREVTSGKMPRGNPSWGGSVEGKLLVELLSKK